MRHVDHRHRGRLAQRLLDALCPALEWIRDGLKSTDDQERTEREAWARQSTVRQSRRDRQEVEDHEDRTR